MLDILGDMTPLVPLATPMNDNTNLIGAGKR